MDSKNALNGRIPAFLFAFVLMAEALKSAFVDMAIAAKDGYLFVVIQVKGQLTNLMDIGDLGTTIFEIVIVIFIIGALIGNIANVTTGITIPHAGFTPNPNLTASPGAVPLTQLYPLVFVALGLLAAFGYFRHVSKA